jgi:hypothetical protein
VIPEAFTSGVEDQDREKDRQSGEFRQLPGIQDEWLP